MAQHPFGPIENQLIVGYYKRRKDPSRLKPEFLFKEVLVETEIHHPAIGFLEPVFYGWSPANGNSSSHDFHVEWTMVRESFFVSSSKLLLHSRGLGYRITFTMPDKLMTRRESSRKLDCQFSIVDIFGETVRSQSTFSLDVDQLFLLKRYLKFAMGNCKRFEIEVTPLHIRIVEDSTKEYKMTTFEPPELESGGRDYGLMSWFDSLFEGQADPTYCGGGYDPAFMRHLSSMTAFLLLEHQLLDAASKRRLKPHVMHLLQCFSGGCQLLTEGKTEKNPSYRHFLALCLEDKVSKWFDGAGDFPSEVCPDYFEKLFEELKMQAAQDDLDDSSDLYLGSSDRADNYFARGMPEPFSIQILVFLNIQPINSILKDVLRISYFTSDQLREIMIEKASHTFHSERFAVEHFKDEDRFTCQLKGEKHSIPFDLKYGKFHDNIFKRSEYAIIPETDNLLIIPREFGLNHCYFLIDISATQQRLSAKASAAAIKRIEGPMVNSLTAGYVAGSPRGIALLGCYSDRGVGIFYHSFTKRGCRWTSLKLDHVFDGIVRPSQTHSVRQAKHSNRVYALVFTSSKSYQFGSAKTYEQDPDRFHFLCTKFCAKTNSFRLLHYNSLQRSLTDTDAYELDTVWLEYGHTTYACIFSCKSQSLWIVVSWRKQFVAVGSRSHTELHRTDFSNKFADVVPLYCISNIVGLLVVSKPRRTEQGYAKYRIGRLRLRL